jgi:hypothetical protein
MGYQQTYDSLSYGQFPDYVQSLLKRSEDGDPIDVLRSEFDSLLDAKGEDVLRRAKNLQHERGRRQLLGCLATLLRIRKSHQITTLNRSSVKSFRLNVGELSTGDKIYLEFPGKKSIEDWHYLGPFELDYAVNVESWVNTRGSQTPRHAEIFSDLYWKTKEAKVELGNQRLASEMKHAVNEVYEGEFPADVLQKDGYLNEFNVGNSPEVLLHSIFWIAIQEDFNYAKYQGRGMSRTVINRICDISTSEFTQTESAFPDTVNIHNYPEYLSIITDDDVKGFDPDDRGDLLPAEAITQSKFAIQ